MNSLKNLMIIAVLAAVGYGVYVSLSRNNVDPGQSSGVADGWPAVPKVDLPSQTASTPPGGPLALGENPAKPSTATAPQAPPAPPLLPSAPLSPPSPSATLGPPIPPDAVAATPPANPPPPAESQGPPSNPVRNLAPPPEVSSAGGTPTSPTSPTGPAENLVQNRFAAFMEEVRKTLDAGKLADAHLALSKFYGDPALSPEQAKQITAMLDQLAGTVIYSRQHHLEPAYVTQSGDTIERIAQKYNVPWQLLARINGLMPPGASNAETATKDQPLPVGRLLKVVRGPFDAVIHLDRRELTLMVDSRYAGRFPIGIGRDQPKLDGTYTVCAKTLNPAYYGPDGINIGPNDAKNPLGGAWIGLTDRIGIHGTNNPQGIGRDDNRGTICTSDRDLQDLYGILSVGSRVTILR